MHHFKSLSVNLLEVVKRELLANDNQLPLLFLPAKFKAGCIKSSSCIRCWEVGTPVAMSAAPVTCDYLPK